jgi:dTDP-4-amino-4,6-dideoxygalactose transaminase
MDVEDLVRRIEHCLHQQGAKPRAIVPVHEFGLAADMDRLAPVAARYSLDLIEDAACAFGARYQDKPVGTFGKFGIFSFHPRKSITTGEGGAIVTNDSRLADLCRQWRNHGQKPGAGRDFGLPGLNYRMTELQAAIGKVQLEKFPFVLQKRRGLTQQYFEALRRSPNLGLPANAPEHTWQTFMPLLPGEVDRSFVIEELWRQGIQAGPGSVAGHLAGHFQPQEPLPISQQLHHSGLALPLHAELSSPQVEMVAAALLKLLEKRACLSVSSSTGKAGP